jgi:hypothetical protein
VSHSSTSAAAFCAGGNSTFAFNDISGTETITFTSGSSTPDATGTIELGTLQMLLTGSSSGNDFSGSFSLGFTSPPATGSFQGTLSGQFSSAELTFNPGEQTFQASQGPFEVFLEINPVELTNTDTVIVYGKLQTVPEPSAQALILSATGALILLRRSLKRRRS